jgi:virginiamycin B lyase
MKYMTTIKLAGVLTLAACSGAGTGSALTADRVSELTLRHARPTQAIGTVTEYTLPGGASTEPLTITLGPDGALWFAEHNNGIGRISTAGSLTEYRVPGTAGPYGIAAGPDRALWFTDILGKIWRVTTDGHFTAYRVPGSAPLPEGITAGPDGAMWFLAQGVDRISMTGQITEFPNAVGFNSIATGPDGALWSPWFDSRHPAGISRTTTAGVSTLYKIPGKNLQVVAVGPDQKIWFTQHHACRPESVGKISTDGSFRRYQVVDCADPNGIAPGPDGAMWFTELRDDHIDRATLDGRITRYPIPTYHSGPYSLTAGPDGAMWFTEVLAGKIGRIQAI